MSEMTILNQKTELVGVGELECHPANPRRGDLDAITESIQTNGWYGMLVAQRSTGYVLAGNHRLLAARRLGIPEVPVVWVDVDDERALRILLADNRTSDLGTYDDAELAELLKNLAAGQDGLVGTGYDAAALDALLDDIASKNGDEEPLRDPEPSAPEKALAVWGVKPGDVWSAGDQRIVCGDSTDAASYDALGVAEASVALLLTDPPYGVDYQQGHRFSPHKGWTKVQQDAYQRRRRQDGLTVPNDSLGATATRELLNDALGLAVKRLRPGGAFYVCSPAGDMELTFRLALIDVGLPLRQSIVWVKDVFAFGRQDYHWRHESILYGWREGAAHYFVDDRTLHTVWEEPRPKVSHEHPTMKPVTLMARAIRNSTHRGEAVLDPFCGSGSTLLACHQLGRAGRGIELEPGYVAVTLSRLQAIGLEPVKE